MSALEIRGLVLEGVSKDRRRTIVQGVDLHVEPGEAVGLVGESGSGKTQTALAIAGLNGPGIRRVSGEIVCDAEVVSAFDERALESRRGRKIAYVFQDPMSAFNPTKRIGPQILDVLAGVRPDLKAKEALEEARRMLAAVALSDADRVLRAYPFELSGGMRQRVLIALAYGCRPTLIVADEPTTALDVTLQAQVLALIADLQARTKTAMLFISHDLAVVQKVCSRLYVMRAGEIVESGPTADVLRAPAHPYTRELISSARAVQSQA